MKPSHFDRWIASYAVGAAEERDEHSHSEPATFNFDIGRTWLVAVTVGQLIA